MSQPMAASSFLAAAVKMEVAMASLHSDIPQTTGVTGAAQKDGHKTGLDVS